MIKKVTIVVPKVLSKCCSQYSRILKPITCDQLLSELEEGILLGLPNWFHYENVCTSCA